MATSPYRIGLDDLRLSRVIKDSYEASHRVYGYRRIYLDLRETGELIGPNRVLKIMKQHNIKAIRGYKVHKYGYSRPSIIYPNHLKEFLMSLTLMKLGSLTLLI